MSGKRKLTDAQIDWAKMIVSRRRDLLRQITLLPTNAEIAEELECSRRWIEVITQACPMNSQSFGGGSGNSRRLAGQSRRSSVQGQKPPACANMPECSLTEPNGGAESRSAHVSIVVRTKT